VVVWRGLDAWRAEAAAITLGEGTLAASGTQIGVEPEPYELRYELTTGDRFVTRRLLATARGHGWERQLDLIRHEGGSWSVNGTELAGVDQALDCDIQNCPVTNTMPVLRDGLLGGGEPHDYVMAWVSVPNLLVHRSAQRYEPIDGRHVRYVSLDSEFTAELELDESGLVLRYPGMAEVVSSDAG
jgi:uncharacterized protein